MMAAREEDVAAPAPPADDAPGPDDTEDGNGPRGQKRGRKRARKTTDKASSSSYEGDEVISGARAKAVIQLVARVFARHQSQQMARIELLNRINTDLLEGEAPFEEEEFTAGLRIMESRNKILVAEETGDVMIVG